MSSKTTNFNLHKIDLTDAPPDITVLNENWDTIDNELKNREVSAFLVTFTGTASNGFTSDKTLSEIRTAYNAGQRVYAKDSEGRVYNLVFISSMYAQFTSVKASAIASVLVAFDSTIDVVVEPLDEFAPAYTYGTDDLTAGTSTLETGKLHFVYE